MKNKLYEASENLYFNDGIIDYSNIPYSFKNTFPNIFKQAGLNNNDSIMLYFNDNKLLMSLIIIFNSFKLMIYLANKSVLYKQINNKINKIKFVISDIYFPNFNERIEKINILGKDIYIYYMHNDLNIFKTLKETIFIFYSSGTKGNESKIARSKTILLKEATAIVKTLNWSSDDVILCNAPTFHSFGQAFGCFAALLAQSRVKYLSSFTLPSHLINELDKNKYSILITTPLYYNQIYEKLLYKDGLKYMLSGGGKLSDKVIKSGIKINNVYGSTETGAVSIQKYILGGNCGSVGTPLKGVQIKLGNVSYVKNNFKICELIVNSNFIYTGRIENNRIIFNKTKKFKLGDIGYYDQYGNLQIFGRKDDIVNIYGEKISLNEIEIIMLKCSLIDCIKIQKKEDPYGNDYLIAYITTNEKCEVEDILIFCRAHLDYYKIPKKIIILEDLKRTETGKIIYEQN